MGDGNFKWYVGRGSEPENYSTVCDSREEAIQIGLNEYHIDGNGFTICEADKSVLSANFNEDWVVETILTDLEENNEECWGEDGPDDPWEPGAVVDLQRRLRTVVSEWLRAYPPRTWSFGDQRHEEYFPCPEDKETA